MTIRHNDRHRNFRKQAGTIIFVTGLFLGLGLLGGCASSYPDISNIQKVAGDALTPSELQDTINDLTLEQKKHREQTSK